MNRRVDFLMFVALALLGWATREASIQSAVFYICAGWYLADFRNSFFYDYVPKWDSWGCRRWQPPKWPKP